MAKPTKTEWDRLKLNLSGAYGEQYLECDGYFICTRLFLDKRTIRLMVFVDGEADFKGNNIVDEGKIDELPEHKRKFWRHCCSNAFPATFIKASEKAFGKRECKKSGYYRRRIHAQPYFNAPGAMITHFKKHCENIAIIDMETYKAGLTHKKASLTK